MKDFVSSFVSSLANTPPSKRNVSSHVVILALSLLTLSVSTYAEKRLVFSQNFDNATAVSYVANTARTFTISSNDNNIVGNDIFSQFTSITCNAKSSAGIGINSNEGQSYLGLFGAYYNNTGGYWSIVKTTPFTQSTSPTALQIEMDVYFDYVSSGTNVGVSFAIGSDFNDGLTNVCPSTDNVVSGFTLPSNNNICINQYNTNNKAISTQKLTNKKNTKITWIINNQSTVLEYVAPNGETAVVDAKCWTLWSDESCFVDNESLSTGGLSGTKLENLYIGSNSGKKHEFRLDDLYIYDLSAAGDVTPPSPTIYALSSAVNPAGKAKVTLDNTELQTGATATATYSDIDADYEFDSWSISGTGATIDNAAANPVTVTMGSANATITLNLKQKSSTGGGEACVELYPATSGTTPTAVGDPIILQETSKGGTIVVSGKPENFSYNSNGLQFGNNSGADVKVTLDYLLQPNSVITLELVAGGSGERGLKLNSADGKTTIATIGFTENCKSGDKGTFTYTVTESDNLSDTNEFILSRNNTVTLTSLTITNCGEAVEQPTPEVQYTVTLDPNGGTCDPTELIYTGTPLELPEPVWEDHTFLGWFTESDTQAENPYTPTSDITLYAHWQQTAGGEEPDPAESCFNMTVKASAYGTKISSGTTDITEYFDTNSGGILSFYCSGGREITKDQGLQFNNDKDYLICTLPAGKLLSGNSVIKIVMHGGTSKNRGFTISETEETQQFSESGKLGTLIYTNNQNLDGQNSFTLERSGSVYLYSIVVEGCAGEAHTPVETVSLTKDKETVYEGCPVTITATATPAATEYKWEIDGEEQSGETGATLTFIPDADGTYKVTCKARNQYNDADEWIEGEIQVDVKSLCGEQLIKVSVSSGKAGAIEGVVGGTADVDLSTNKNSENKLDDGKFFGITLAYGSFKEGDRVNINISKAADLGRIALYADKEMKTTIYEGSDYGIEGDNLITLPQTAEGLTSLWIVRNNNINDNKWNPYINFVSVERLCGPYVSIVPSKPQIGCDGVELGFEIHNAQECDITNIQWSLNGNVIPDANEDTYQATVAGTYSVEVTLADGTTVTASLTLTSEAVVEALVPKLIYQFAAMRGTENNEEGAIDNNKNRPYTSDDKYPLFSVAPAADGKNPWTATVEIHKKDQNGEVCYTSTTYPWIEEYEPAENDTITLVANYAELRDYILNDSQWQIQEGEAQTADCDNHILRTGDTIMVKVAVKDCPVSERQVPIVISDKYSLAYIIRGNVDGDFYNDLYAPDTNDNFYQTLSERYEVTQVNAYAPFRKLNYAPFDIVVLSDYPKATGSDTDADLMNRRDTVKMGALAQLVDYKPLFSLKGFLSALPQWKELGLAGNPRAPENVTDMTVLCEHRVLGTSGSKMDGDRKIQMLSGGADNKGLQGFLVEGLQNFIPIAVIDTIDDNGQTVEGALIACCERQIKTEARMIILSIYSGAMDQLTDDGKDAIYEIVDYLLDARPAKVEDCAYIFNGEGNNTSWKDPKNWATGSVPQSYNTIRIEAPCEIDDNVEAVSVRINNTNGSLTIAPNGALKVTDKFYMYAGADHYDKLLSVTEPDLITIKADDKGNGMLIHTHNDAHPLYATVQLYSAAYYEEDYTSESTATKYWTYFGVPVKEVKIPENFLYAYTYLWSESEGWIRKADDALEPFYGYALSQAKAETFELKGQLASTDSVAIKLTKTSSDGGMDGMNLVGNSWTAPIHISQMTKADFGDAEQTIYIYQTGRDPEDGPTVADGQNKGSAGYWQAIPLGLADVIGADADEYDISPVIPAMQAFEINIEKNTEETKLHLVYDRIVRNPLTEQYNNAPRRVAANRTDPLLMRIRVEDSNTAATLYLLEDESFTEGFDNGWDGRYMGNDGRTAGLWAYSEAGDMSVMAQPKIDGTTLGFKAGRESDYTFSFKWNGSPLWLNDIMLQRSVAIEMGNTYTFRASDTDPANRFCISSEPYSGGTETSLSDIVLTDGVLSVNNPTGERLTLSVYDATGRLCSRTISTDHLLTTDITDVCQGVYMISVEGENTNIVKKVIR